jgi:hypothetical protein
LSVISMVVTSEREELGPEGGYRILGEEATRA